MHDVMIKAMLKIMMSQMYCYITTGNIQCTRAMKNYLSFHTSEYLCMTRHTHAAAVRICFVSFICDDRKPAQIWAAHTVLRSLLEPWENQRMMKYKFRNMDHSHKNMSGSYFSKHISLWMHITAMTSWPKRFSH